MSGAEAQRKRSAVPDVHGGASSTAKRWRLSMLFHYLAGTHVALLFPIVTVFCE